MHVTGRQWEIRLPTLEDSTPPAVDKDDAARRRKALLAGDLRNVHALAAEIFENELAHRIVTYHAAERDTTAESGERHQGGRYRTSARFEESLGAVFLIGSRKRVEQHGDVSYRDTESENVEIRHLWVFLPQR